MHERAHRVAGAPGDAVGVVGVDAGVRVAPLVGQQEEVGEHAAILPVRHRTGQGRVLSNLRNTGRERLVAVVLDGRPARTATG